MFSDTKYTVIALSANNEGIMCVVVKGSVFLFVKPFHFDYLNSIPSQI